MGFDVNRWVKYARARIDAAVGQGNEGLDRREAEREADLADRPWLAADGTAPTLDEARARIRWEADRQERAARSETAGGSDATGEDDTAAGEPPAERGKPAPGRGKVATGNGPASGGTSTGDGARDPADLERDAEREGARIELEERSRRAADRLAQIRRELGVDDV